MILSFGWMLGVLLKKVEYKTFNAAQSQTPQFAQKLLHYWNEQEQNQWEKLLKVRHSADVRGLFSALNVNFGGSWQCWSLAEIEHLQTFRAGAIAAAMWKKSSGYAQKPFGNQNI